MPGTSCRGRFVGETVNTVVAIDELARWPLVPGWLNPHDTVTRFHAGGIADGLVCSPSST